VISLDSNVLGASIKRTGEPYHDPELELSKKITRENVTSIGRALALAEIPRALASSTKIQLVLSVAVLFAGSLTIFIASFVCYDRFSA
jgi:hypothetical protein